MEGARGLVASPSDRHGDHGDEYVLRSRGPSRPVEDVVSTLNAKLKGQVGQPVLVVEQTDYHSGGRGYGHDIDTSLSLGVLDGEEVTPPKKASVLEHLFIPTKKHVSGRVVVPFARKSDQWEESKEGSIGVYSWYKLRDPVLLKRNAGKKEMRDLLFQIQQEQKRVGYAVYVGDEVELFFRSGVYGHLELFDRMGKGTLPPISPRYARGLLMIGAEPSESFRDQYQKSVTEIKLGVIHDLEELVAKEAGLKIKIKDFANSADGDIIDDVTVALHTGHDREEVKAIKGSIAGALEQAFSLGMHREELVLPWQKPGMHIDVPEYIRGLAQQYNVPIPKN